jgi:hypothetical protein
VDTCWCEAADESSLWAAGTTAGALSLAADNARRSTVVNAAAEATSSAGFGSAGTGSSFVIGVGVSGGAALAGIGDVAKATPGVAGVGVMVTGLGAAGKNAIGAWSTGAAWPGTVSGVARLSFALARDGAGGLPPLFAGIWLSSSRD